VHNLGKEIEYAKKQAEEDRKLLAALRTDHEKLMKEIKVLEGATDDYANDALRKQQREEEH